MITSQSVLKCFKKTKSLCTDGVSSRLCSTNHSCGLCCWWEQNLSVIWFGPSSAWCRKTCWNYMGACNTAIMRRTHVIVACTTVCWFVSTRSRVVEEKRRSGQLSGETFTSKGKQLPRLLQSANTYWSCYTLPMCLSGRAGAQISAAASLSLAKGMQT